ncbi:ubiquitin-like small modifier protein 1 [Natronorubrum tibetense]|uniref:MoaD family protein n=1 Tax=Natronorubrum tibetense GA33 TaxID=1114856 RepID=L9VNT5_9EURY|nr:ubiquitin-like small modifier protein 1 [Natronorubrum tibetense]ELY38880.1 MoaD family protein [Natronorubrum tibetense GA33]
MIDVVLYGPVRDTVGEKTLTASGDTVDAVLSELFVEYPELEPALRDGDEFRSEVNVLVNGRKLATLDGIDTVLGDDDTVQVTAAMSGGCR